MLLEKIQNDLKVALKSRDEVKVSTLRMLVAALKNERIAKNADLTEQDELVVIGKQAKQRTDSIEQYTKGGRADLVKKETAERGIIQSYLPEQMSDDEIRSIAQQTMEKLGVSDTSGIGKIMGALMGELKGRADGTAVKRVVESLLKK